MNDRMGAKPWIAHSRFDLASVLFERDGPGDRELAVAELSLAAAICQELGMPTLEKKVAQRFGDRVVERRPEPAGPARSSVFRQEGEYWTVVFGADAFRLRDTKGLVYMAYLLQNPGREFHVLDLATMEHGGSLGATPTNASRDAELNVGRPSDTGPLLDEQSKAAYRQRLLELDDDLEEATAAFDSVRAAKLREERDFLADELSAAMGLGGRDRRAASQAERARVNITRALKGAVNRIREYSPNLADHLDATIHTGTFCSYSPDPRVPTTWQI